MRGRRGPAPPGRALLGWALLLLALPLVPLAMMQAPNRYAAGPGLDALDCDGPLRTTILSVPPLLLYAAGFLINLRGRHGRLSPAASALCLLLCAALVPGLVRAAAEERRQAAACDAA